MRTQWVKHKNPTAEEWVSEHTGEMSAHDVMWSPINKITTVLVHIGASRLL